MNTKNDGLNQSIKGMSSQTIIITECNQQKEQLNSQVNQLTSNNKSLLL